MNTDKFAGHTLGPRAITTTRNSCSGCPSLELKKWMDYLENDETDSGVSARCAIANKSITAYWDERYSVPEFCNFAVVATPSAPELLAENERLSAGGDMSLRDQILARIDATPYRPPSIKDFIYATHELFHTIQRELASMLAAGIIDTETGDSGLTYRRAKAPYIEAEKPRTVSVCDHAGIEYFPSKRQQPRLPKAGSEALKNAERAAEVPKAESKNSLAMYKKAHAIVVNERKREEKLKLAALKKLTSRQERNASKDQVTKLLTYPMSAAQFAAIAGIDKETANARFGGMNARGFLQSDNLESPKIFFFAHMEPFDVGHYRDQAKAFRIKSTGYDFEQMIAEYQRGDLIKVMCAKWTCNNQKISEIMRLNGIPVRRRNHKSDTAQK